MINRPKVSLKPLPKENKKNDGQLQKKLAILFGKEK